MKHTTCSRGRFLLSSSPHSGPVSLAQRRIQFHARTFLAFEAGSSDNRDSGPLQQVTCVTLFSLARACATICHFALELEIRRLRAWMRRAPASFWGSNSSKRLGMSNKPLPERPRLLTETLQVCSCAREACVVSTWAQGGCGWNEALNCRWDSNKLSLDLFSAAQEGGW